MAPHLSEAHNGSPHTTVKPRFAILGAGSRGTVYARAVTESGLGTIAAVAEPILFKRNLLGSRYIWSGSDPAHGQSFSHWQQFIEYERKRRLDEEAGLSVVPGVDAVFVCVRDEQHVDVLTALAPLGLHIMSEKPLATSLEDCLRIDQSLKDYPERIFAIGHVLRYSPHNMLLRHLLLEEKVIGDILSIEHTEPVGWWHFSHSYVRGHWRKESSTAPSLLTKSCHDIDFLLWLLCSPSASDDEEPHLPARISSMGSLKQFRRQNKPKTAENATNCTSCKLQESCKYSAKRIYYDRHLARGHTDWPVDIVNPQIGTILQSAGPDAARDALMTSLAEDYDVKTVPLRDIEERPWFGRCVWESDNDVVDDQFVTIEWDDEETGKGAKTASFHMIAQTLAQCERRGRIYGSSGEIHYDSTRITLHDFEKDTTKAFDPEVPKSSHHGGGDDGLTRQFVKAVVSVIEGTKSVSQAQTEYLGCTIDEVVRSHAVVFAAEEARRECRVVDWKDWWANAGQKIVLNDG